MSESASPNDPPVEPAPESGDAPVSGDAAESGDAPKKKSSGHHQSFWLWVMCLTGVDYFSTLGYLPAIAYDATGELSPIATILLIGVTLLGALPVYAYVAKRSPHGMGSISLLEQLVKGWLGKFLVLSLLGFVATAFIFTKTLSASDAAEHLVKNPLLEQYLPMLGRLISEDRQRLLFTLILLMVLGATFLRGFREVIGLAVIIVGVYLTLNAVIIFSGISYLFTNPDQFGLWIDNLNNPSAWGIENPPLAGGGWLVIIALCIFYFPNLALGLSGFETGLMVMPLIKGNPTDTKTNLAGRIRNTRKLLITAAVIMCFYLLGSSFVTATLIDENALKNHTAAEKTEIANLTTLKEEGKLDSTQESRLTALRKKGAAVNRTLAYLAHAEGDLKINPMIFGTLFGTIYDIATIVILWFAGASAMAGLLNLVPQYLPRYGMAPDWAKAIRPLILLFTGINLFVTWIYRADVHAQSGEYATGVLVFIFSGCLATLIDRWRSRPKERFSRKLIWAASLGIFSIITLIFFYATISIMINQPDGILIALLVIVLIVVTSMISRAARSTELRFTGFTFVDETSRFLWDSLKLLEFPALVPHRPGTRSLAKKEESIRKEHRLSPEVPVVFLEVELGDASEFLQSPLMEIIQEEGRFIIRVTRCASIAHVIAAIGLELSKHGQPPEIHFGWSDESPIAANLGFLLFGEGNVPWIVRSLIVKEQSDPQKQPRIIIG